VYASPNIIRVMTSRWARWAGNVARMKDIIITYKILVGKPEDRRPLGRSRHRWEDNIRIDLREIV